MSPAGRRPGKIDTRTLRSWTPPVTALRSRATADDDAGDRRLGLASTRRSCTTTSAPRASCSPPPSTSRSRQAHCCRRCSRTAMPARGSWRCSSPGTTRRPEDGCWPSSARLLQHEPRRHAPNVPSPRSRRHVRHHPASEDAELRATLLGSQLIGMAIARYVIALPPLSTASTAELVAAYGPTIQRYLTGKCELSDFRARRRAQADPGDVDT